MRRSGQSAFHPGLLVAARKARGITGGYHRTTFSCALRGFCYPVFVWGFKTLATEDVRVTREEVSLTKGWLFRRTWLLAGDVIEDLHVVSGTVDDHSAVMLQSDETMLRFGKHLPPPEK